MIHQLRITRLEKLQKVRQRSRQNDMESKQAQQVSDSTVQKKRCTSTNIHESIFNTKWAFAAVYLQFRVMCKHKPVLCLED